MRSSRASGMSHVPRLVGAGVAVVVLAGGLVACGGDDEPEAAPSPTAPASSSAAGTPSPSEPPAVQLPAEAKERTDEGAAAFLVHWFDVFNRAVATLDTEQLSAISSPQCSVCAEFIGHIDEVRAGNGWIEMDPWLAGEPQVVVPAQGRKGPAVAVTIRTASERYKLSPESKVVAEGKAGLSQFSSQIDWRDGAWSMSALGLA